MLTYVCGGWKWGDTEKDKKLYFCILSLGISDMFVKGKNENKAIVLTSIIIFITGLEYMCWNESILHNSPSHRDTVENFAQ